MNQIRPEKMLLIGEFSVLDNRPPLLLTMFVYAYTS